MLRQVRESSDVNRNAGTTLCGYGEGLSRGSVSTGFLDSRRVAYFEL